MTARRGQVAVYLAMVLLALTVLMLANVNMFLAVRAKNRMMNAVDEAAIAAAKYQGELLNRLGEMNVEHLRAAVRGEEWDGSAGEMQMLSFLGPVDALERANVAAGNWGYSSGGEPRALEGFREHIQEIRNCPDLYPRDDRNQLWLTYANKLDAALGGSPAILPWYMEMVNPASSGGLFANWGFYDVLDAKAWCWFTIGNNAAYLDEDPTQVVPVEVTPVEVPENSEVFSLHVTYGGWMDSGWAEEWTAKGFSETWTNFVLRVTGCESFATNAYAASPNEVWAFYDGNWKTWSTTFNPDNFPIAGTVKGEYDVAGCVASCMMMGAIPQLAKGDKGGTESRDMTVTAEAKPIGTVEGLDGGTAPVTAYHSFIAPSRPGQRIFTEANLTLVGSVPRSPGVSMSPDWYDHVKNHSPATASGLGCRYCQLWRQWMDPGFRLSIRQWLQTHKDSCRPSGGEGGMKGGYPYAH